GLLPFVPISAVTEEQRPGIIQELKARLRRHDRPEGEGTVDHELSRLGGEPMPSLSPPDRQTVDRIVDHLQKCRSILFVTGAGMSAESGLPTYRGVGGLYNSGETTEGFAIEEMLSGEMFRTRPEWTWKYLREIEEACRGATFNRGHAILAEMERHFSRVWTLTQNVDGFHRSAGSRNIIDIHGDLREICCTHCPYRVTVVDYRGFADLPRCPDCTALLRPDVVLF